MLFLKIKYMFLIYIYIEIIHVSGTLIYQCLQSFTKTCSLSLYSETCIRNKTCSAIIRNPYRLTCFTNMTCFIFLICLDNLEHVSSAIAASAQPAQQPGSGARHQSSFHTGYCCQLCRTSDEFSKTEIPATESRSTPRYPLPGSGHQVSWELPTALSRSQLRLPGFGPGGPGILGLVVWFGGGWHDGRDRVGGGAPRDSMGRRNDSII